MDLSLTVPNAKVQRVVDAFNSVENSNGTLEQAVIDAGPVQQDQLDAVQDWLEVYWADKLRSRVLSFEERQAGLDARANAEDPLS
jgi:hypothetical protein